MVTTERLETETTGQVSSQRVAPEHQELKRRGPLGSAVRWIWNNIIPDVPQPPHDRAPRANRNSPGPLF